MARIVCLDFSQMFGSIACSRSSASSSLGAGFAAPPSRLLCPGLDVSLKAKNQQTTAVQQLDLNIQPPLLAGFESRIPKIA